MTQEIINTIDGIQVTLNAGGMNTINIILAFVMYGVALGIKPQIFVEVFKKPKSVLLGILCQLSVILTPFNFWCWGSIYLHSAAVSAEIPTLVIPLWDVFKTIFILLGIPLVLGILTSHYLPKVAAVLKKPLQWLSIGIFVAMVVLSFGSNLDAFLKCIKYIFLVVLVHNLLALGIGFGVGTIGKVPYKDRRTLTIETGIQNSGLGLALMLGTSLFANFPPHGGMLVITAWWGIWHIISGLTVATLFNRCKSDA